VIAQCVICGETRRRAAKWPIGAVCFSCYQKARSRPGQCSDCGELRVLVAGAHLSPDTGSVKPTVCGGCAGSKFVYLCRRCGGGEEPYKGGLCVRCAARDQLEEAFGAVRTSSPESAPALLVEALSASRRPRSVIQWLSNPRGGARVVKELLDQSIIVDHAALDTFDEREIWSLRRSLVDLGALPERHEPIARLDALLEKKVAPLPPETRRLVQTYGSWWLLRRSRRRYETTGKFTYSSFRVAGRRLDQVISFLTWLSNNAVPLELLDQHILDRWLAEPRSDPRAASDFLRWAASRHLAPRLVTTYRPDREPTEAITEEQRWTDLTRCLSDDSVPDDVRAAGSLVLLYGLQLAQVVGLTTKHLHGDPNHTSATVKSFSVQIGGPTILVPPPLGLILQRLPAAPASSTSLIVAPPDRPPWLFPGRGSAGHVTYTGLARRMRGYGLRVRPSRNSALISLAADLPAPVISDLFGMSIASAVKWTRRAGRDWQGYISALQQRERLTQQGKSMQRPFTPGRTEVSKTKVLR
jgi:hypothetical protein